MTQRSPQLFTLFEHAMGCALFRVLEYEEGDSFIDTVKQTVSDLNAFKEMIQVVAFQPFSSGRETLEYMNNSSEGILMENVKEFLENNLPKSKKKKPVLLGVQEAKMATAITEALGIACSINKEVLEVIRGIRLHFHNLIEGIKDRSTACKSQLALGHHYARAKVKFNVNRIDNMVIQSISLIDQLDKDINNFAMRVREWYSFHFPELIKVVPENHLYVKCVDAIKDRKQLPQDIHQQLENILMDTDKADNILKLANSSMGMEISPLDMENITIFATRVDSLMNRRKELMEYLKRKMQNVAPNLAALIGETVGARLIAHAGSLVNLAKFPASTVQILGAEKALFRAIKTRGNTPKYGLIYHSSFIGRAGKTNKGRISRYLANKCSVATRIDCFRDIPTEVFGSKMKGQVEDRLKFYETGDIPAKNVDVMTTALSEADVVAAAIARQRRKAEKREKKRKSQMLAELSEIPITDMSVTGQNEDNMVVKSEKKKKRKRESVNDSETLNSGNCEIHETDNAEPPKKKNLTEEVREKLMKENLPNDEEEMMDEEKLRQIKKAKKKAKKKLRASQISANGDDSVLTGDGSMLNDTSVLTTDGSMFNDTSGLTTDGSMLNNTSILTNDSIHSNMNISTEGPVDEHLDNGIVKKKKKKKKKNKQQDE